MNEKISVHPRFLRNPRSIVLELLSPAKDLECGIAAINCGADAVYIGAPKYGARAAVGNLVADIEKLINYAHKFWAKVYVTVNTIIYDEELEDVQNLIHQLYKIGTDAIIIQDMGILEMDIPPIPLFASTQAHNYSLEKIKFLEEVGFQRIILARELSLEQIKEIKESAKVDLEFFVHGSLCVCFSGQCYFSYATTGRSANRGECSQPCRLFYSLEDANGKTIIEDKYLLSLKDLNLSSHLKEMVEAGITSFKIEGRLKDINYIKNITGFYRQKLDEIMNGDKSLQKSSSGKVFFTFNPDPDKTFNRGYTEYFLKGNTKNIASINTQKSLGKYIGKVKIIGKDYFEVNTTEKFVNDDGICFFDSRDVMQGMILSKVIDNRIYTNELDGLSIGTKIYRNRDHQFTKELSRDNTKRKIEAFIEIEEEVDRLLIYATDEDNNKISYEYMFEIIPAKDPAKFLETIEKQFKKSGDSIFEVKDVKIIFAEPFFIPIAKINEMRRAVLDLLETDRIKNFPRQIVEIQKTNIPYPERKLTYLGNVVNRKAKQFYERHGVENIENGFELLKETKDKIILTSKYCIKEQLNLCPFETDGFNVKDIKEPLFLKFNRKKYQLEFNCKKCEMSIIL
ncbi:MAG: U32 family peptidase [Ignavibacteriales bacterium]|nr:U32 family peptidase [Ignavibacteriales bacterium]